MCVIYAYDICIFVSMIYAYDICVWYMVYVNGICVWHVFGTCPFRVSLASNSTFTTGEATTPWGWSGIRGVDKPVTRHSIWSPLWHDPPVRYPEEGSWLLTSWKTDLISTMGTINQLSNSEISWFLKPINYVRTSDWRNCRRTLLLWILHCLFSCIEFYTFILYIISLVIIKVVYLYFV